jgi:hypothetical protein
MTQAVPVPPHQEHLVLWFAFYVVLSVVFATPATYFAIRRGVWPGVLAGIATYVGLGVLSFATICVLVAILGGGAFGVGFGELLMLGLMAMFLVPTLVLGLVLAAVVRWRARRRPSEPST